MITQLVNETFDEDFNPRSRHVIEGKYLESINCFRFNINGKDIDFPETWSFFANINSNVLPLETWELARFSTENDPLKLVQIFNPSSGKILFFIQEERFFLQFDY